MGLHSEEHFCNIRTQVDVYLQQNILFLSNHCCKDCNLTVK